MKLKHIFFTLAALAFFSRAQAQVKIGNNPGTINPSAALEIESTNKGFLPPRVTLTSSTDVTTIPSPAVGLLVYNIANAGTGTAAVKANTIYTWNGQNWAAIQSTSENAKALSYVSATSSPISINTTNETTVCLGELCIRASSTSPSAAVLQIKVSAPGGSLVGLTESRYGAGGCNPCSNYNNNIAATQDTWLSTAAGANPSLRDFSTGNIVLYNTHKAYRYTMIANGNTAATGGVVAAQSSVVVFLEELN